MARFDQYHRARDQFEEIGRPQVSAPFNAVGPAVYRVPSSDGKGNMTLGFRLLTVDENMKGRDNIANYLASLLNDDAKREQAKPEKDADIPGKGK